MPAPQDRAAFYLEVGRKIRDARAARRMSQEALADVVSLTRTSITNIEKGRQKLLLHTLWEIAQALDAPPATLFPTPKPSNPDERIPNKLLEGLSETDKKLITSAVTPPDKDR